MTQASVPASQTSKKAAHQPHQLIQTRQIQRLFANPQEELSYELGQAVQMAPPFYTRLLASSLCLLVVGAVAWAQLSEVEEVAIAPGKLSPKTEARPIKSLGDGTIGKVRVKAGDRIRPGQILVERDPEVQEGEVQRLQNSLKLVQQDLARLQSEAQGGVGSGGLTLQDQLLAARLREFEQTQQGAIAEAQRQQSTIAEAKVRLERLTDNLRNAQTSLKNSRALVISAQEREQRIRQLEVEAPGALPRMDYLTAKDQLTEAQDRLNQADDRIESLVQDQAAQRQTIVQAKQGYGGALSAVARLKSQRQSEILSRLTQRREELVSLQGQLDQARKLRKREVVRAPIAGTVYNLKVTLGPVQAGEELLSILPANTELVVEAKLMNSDIGFVKVGNRVKLKVASFPYQEFGYMEGTVIRLSPDAVADKDLGLIFPVQIRVKRNDIRVHDKPVTLQPGMMVTAEIVTRKKSILGFLLEPVARRFAEAFSVR
jgi:HlyD family secretion protein